MKDPLLPSPLRRHCLRAFSLVELLTALAIVMVLALLGVAGVQNSLEQTRAVRCMANLRQIGVGMLGYTTEHRGRLPGPLLPSQGPRYNKVNGEVAAYLASYLAPYLGIPEAPSGPLLTLQQAQQIAPMFYCPSFGRAVKENFANSYLMRWRIIEMGTNMPPWGNYGTSTPQIPKNISQIPDRAKTWAISDLDQQCPDLPPESWVARVPATPVHGKHRFALFFDWHVGRIGVDGKSL